MAASDIQTNSQKPKRATVDGNTAEQHSIPDQIAADRYANAGNAMTSKKAGIKLRQFRNQGTT